MFPKPNVSTSRLKISLASVALDRDIACKRASGSGSSVLSTPYTTGRIKPAPCSIFDQEAPTSNQIQGRLIDTGVTTTRTALAAASPELILASQSSPGRTTPGTLEA